ncbi:hypothetical protein [Pontibacillus sp. HMF3514]|uniref:hypothetical protein n=1 Tax=Pontibacillus sp. HMF3514 TaxID=2692425 RepID=UPI00131F8D06|nr:hypothetical protein [Pontibacillus sp. HMF3514]QHE51748.1 hypothetical protein GS400_06720 [Pontibacillus sp. HMF3514]
MLYAVSLYIIKYLLMLIGIVLSALGVWELRVGTQKRRYLTFVILGAVVIILSQALMQIWGMIGMFGM